MRRSPHDWDVLAVTTPQRMDECGFQEAVNDNGTTRFRVYVHPELGKGEVQVALPRRDIKVGPGHGGFVTEGVDTLEEDLLRRDFTMNAMALDSAGTLVDPFGGQHDINACRIRHVNDDTYADDPLRPVRGCRFEAQLGFTMAHQTILQGQKLVAKGEMATLHANRIRVEHDKAIMGTMPRKFYEAMFRNHALHVWFPEVYQLLGATQVCAYHPEGDAFEHVMQCLQFAAAAEYSFNQRLAVLVHDYGKGLTPRTELPHHYGHEDRTDGVVDFVRRFGYGATMEKRLVLMVNDHMVAHRVNAMRPSKRVALWLRQRRQADDFIRMVEADENGRGSASTGQLNHDLRKVFDCLGRTDTRGFADLTEEQRMHAYINQLRRGEQT